MESFLLHFKSIETPKRGFTLVELLVVVSIITIVTSIALLGQGNFNRSLVLTDTAYTVAFSVRQAQSYGLSSRVFSGISNAGYGVNFTANSESYELFADIYPASPGSALGGVCPGHAQTSIVPEARPGNCVYNGDQNEMVETYTFKKGFTVNTVCGRDDNSNLRCLGTDFDTFTISFLRPNTESIFVGKRSTAHTSLQDACIHVRAPDGTNERIVYVSKVGQVAVLPSCP